MLEYDKKDKMKLIEQLELYRLEHKLSQEELAKQLDMHPITVHRWLKGRKHPNKIHTYCIKKFLEEKGNKNKKWK